MTSLQTYTSTKCCLLFLLIYLSNLCSTSYTNMMLCPNTFGCRCIPGVKTHCCCVGPEVSEIPANISRLVKTLKLMNTSIAEIDGDLLEPYKLLEVLEISGSSKLTVFNADSLKPLTHLRKLSITLCPNLLDITGTLIVHNYKVQTITLAQNGIRFMPKLEMSRRNRMEVDIDLSHNAIRYIGNGQIKGIRARTFRMSHNELEEILGKPFQDCEFINLVLSHNYELEHLSADTFKNIVGLQTLDLSNTKITQLPAAGLKNLRSLTLKNVPSLKSLPPVLSFTHLQKAHFTYPHHCCLFKHVDQALEYGNNSREIHGRICKSMGKRVERFRRIADELSTTMLNPAAFTNFVTQKAVTPEAQYNFFIENFLKGFVVGDDDTMSLPDDDDAPPPFNKDELGIERCEEVAEVVKNFYFNIICTPEPDVLNPCENVVGYPLLSKAIWVVWIAAIVGNVLVWIVLAMAYEKRMKVHYMFMFNLSVADMITGVYLAFLAFEDTITADEYYRHAVGWQTGWGCSTAGFLAVFASQLSIISMFLIAFEMAYNTRKAIMGYRVVFPVAVSMMAVGYLFSLTMAALPLLVTGISGYSTTSICLPLKVETLYDKMYIVFGLCFNVLAFFGMAVCYGFIVWMLRDPSTPNRAEDTALYVKMALLVVTDMLCWFPTLFFGITAAIGYPLISLSNAKIFLVFFFPINAFMNPFLYVFFTKVIQRHVKRKALPILDKMKKTTSGILSSTIHNSFYNAQPPGDRSRNEENMSPGSERFLGVTQLTSLNSTPRCSYRVEPGSFDSTCSRKSPRVSFQDDVQYDEPVKSPGPSADNSNGLARRFRRLFKKISAIQEVPEHSGSEGPLPSVIAEQEENEADLHTPSDTPGPSRKRSSIAAVRRPVHSIRHREESTKSSGQDSGNGSMASIATNGVIVHDRPLLAGLDDMESLLASSSSQARGHRGSEPHVQVPHFTLGPQEESPPQPNHRPHHSFFRWHHNDRRRSVPTITPLLVVSECSDASSNT